MLKDFVDNQWVESFGQSKSDVINPATGEKLDTCPLGTPDDVDRAVQAAKTAFPKWRKTPAADRIQFFFKLKQLLEDHSDELAESITLENGKTLAEARGSVRRGIQMVETATSIPTLMMGNHFEDIAPGIDCQAVRRPMGVFTAICPFNFPAMVPFWFWPFAVACGNTYVIKPSERVPLTQKRIFELIQKAGFPKGVINLVHGGKEVVDSLCSHPDVSGVSFVGSSPVAKHVYERSSQFGKRVQSLGGAKNFMVVLPDAVMDQAAKTALESIIGCAGERCLAGSVVLSVGEATQKEVENLMVEKASQITIGSGLDPKTQMGPLISQASKDRVCKMIQTASSEGARILLDGREGVDTLPGYFLKPTVLTDIKKGMEIAKEEVFGPVVCLAKTETLDDAIAWINESKYGNTTTLFTSSGSAARKFSYEVDPSMIGINIGVPAPMSFFSFGGTKESFFGNAKAHGQACIDFFTDSKVTIQRWFVGERSSIW